MFFPIFFDVLQVCLMVITYFLHFFIDFPLLLRVGKEFVEVLLELLEIVSLLDLFHGLGFLLLLRLSAFVLWFCVGELGELGLAVVFCLDVSVEGGIAEI
jgi:hypothetical protein